MTTKTVKPSASEIAREFYSAAKAGNWKIEARDTIVTITRHFAPGDNAEFVSCDGDYYGVLSTLRARGGSMWGTDSASVGGHVALRTGTFRMNVSGVGKRVVSEILKLQAAE